MEIRYSKSEANIAAKEFIEEVSKLERKFGFTFNSDINIYLNYRSKERDTIWDVVNLGFQGDDSGLKVTDYDSYRREALSKLTEKEIEILGLDK